MKKAILYIHGKGGSYTEAEKYRENCPEYDVIGVDYEVDFPWIVKGIIKEAYDKTASEYDSVTVIANSIGAFFTMQALYNCDLEKALFISPILNMEKLIYDMMNWADVTEQELYDKKEIATNFGETLSWDYLQYVKGSKVDWSVPTSILYAGPDNLTARPTVDEFVLKHNANLTVMENGEHWFHTKEQLLFLDKWMKETIK